jgi:hypothetical protein
MEAEAMGFSSSSENTSPGSRPSSSRKVVRTSSMEKGGTRSRHFLNSTQ